jgi:hypothetical protein
VVTLGPMSRSRRPLVALALAALLVGGGAACSDDDDAGPSGTSVPATTVLATTTTTTGSSTTAPSTSATPPGGPASTLPPGPSQPGPGTGDACATLAGTLALQDLLPRDGLSWPDERRRVVTDGRLNAQLYDRAAGQLPGAEGQYATMLATYATFVADRTQDAESASAARSAIDTYQQQGEVAAANTELDRWRGVNCS